MPSRRYYIALAPFDHINGKMAPSRVKCPNTEDPEHTTVSGFWYGYRRPGIDISRFAVRTESRDLTTHPYTPREDENRTLFTAALIAVRDHHQIASDWELMLHDFEQQHQYTTAIGYAVAACRANGGEWLAEWTSG